MSDRLDDKLNAAMKKKRKLFFAIVFIALVISGVAVGGYVLVPNLGLSEESTVAETKDEKPVSAPQPMTEEQRKSLQQALKMTNDQVKSVVNDEAKVDWAKDRIESLSNSMEAAYAIYAQGAHQPTKNKLEEITAELEQLAADYREDYTALYQQSLSAFNAGEIYDARQFNKKSLAIHPNFSKAIQLQQRLDVYEQAQALMEQARIGEVENNLDKVYRSYQQLVQIDPTPARQRKLEEINGKRIDRDFSATLKKAADALDNNDYESAERLLAVASNLDSSRPELSTLKARLASGLKDQSAKQTESQIRVFVAADEWPTVKVLAEKAIKSHPDNRVISGALDSAENIERANRLLDDYINRPERLSDQRIMNNAISAIADVSGSAQLSAKLAARVSQLESLIDQHNQRIPVIVKSDNRTDIRVLRVGQIGEVSEKTIKLKPGTYQFEGRCEGYQTVLKTVVVSRTESEQTVEIICTSRV